MRVYTSFEEARNIQNPVVTTGSFDGVHVGHRAIINRINNIARVINGESVLITFYPHPRKVLYPNSSGKDLKLINSQEEKIKLLKEAGLKNLIIINFTKEFSLTTSEDFVKRYLIGILEARVIVVGFNHHFGHNKSGDYQYLFKIKDELGFEVEEIPEQELHNETVSSTRIRKALHEGKIQKANAYLDHYYLMQCDFKGLNHGIVNGYSGFELQTDNSEKLYLPVGAYAVSTQFEKERLKGVAYISYKICMNNDTTGFNCNVWLTNSAGQSLGEKRSLIVYFHKRIGEKCVKPYDNDFSKKLHADSKTIEELIY